MAQPTELDPVFLQVWLTRASELVPISDLALEAKLVQKRPEFQVGLIFVSV